MSRRIFLLSPADCGGKRARLLLDGRGSLELARRLGAGEATLGEIFSFLSGLYFRGKLAYARAFARPPEGLPGVFVITPCCGLVESDALTSIRELRRFARVDVDPQERRYRAPLHRDAARLGGSLNGSCEIVLLGSIATGKYVEPLLEACGPRLRFPAEFVGRGDMSRGGLLLRRVEERSELEYMAAGGAVRRGARPPRLAPRS